MADGSQKIGSRDALVYDMLLLAFVAFLKNVERGSATGKNDGMAL